jgi:hypothetical protein
MFNLQINASQVDLTLHGDYPVHLDLGSAPSPILDLSVGVGPMGPQGVPGPAGIESLLIAAIPLGGLRAVTGSGVYADQGTMEELLGISLDAGSAGSSVRVRSAGVIEDPSWSWVTGPVFVGPSGVLVQTPPIGIVRRIAWATAPTRIVVDIHPSIQTA